MPEVAAIFAAVLAGYVLGWYAGRRSCRRAIRRGWEAFERCQDALFRERGHL